jgi:hypothetical protein
VIDYPRGVGIDDEALRSFQAVGLVEAVRRHTVPNQIMRFVDKRGRVLAAIAPTAQPFGWPRRSGFIQPLVDRELGRRAEALPACAPAIAAQHRRLPRGRRRQSSSTSSPSMRTAKRWAPCGR